jgi:CheY-like chemotaxis protein
MEPKWVLIVDDDETIRVVLAELFLFEGYNVYTAENGQEALAVIELVRFDALLVDLSMPVMDGWQLRRALRDRGTLTPFLAMTASARSPAELARELNATACLIKPFDSDTVLRAVDRAIHQTGRLVPT